MNMAAVSSGTPASSGGSGIQPGDAAGWATPTLEWGTRHNNTPSFPATVETGEVAILIATRPGVQSITTPAGFTNLLGGHTGRGYWFYKVTDGTEGGTSVAVSGGIQCANIVVISGLDTGALAAAANGGSTTSGNIPMPEHTPGATAALVLMSCHGLSGPNPAPWPSTPNPAEMEQDERFHASGSGKYASFVTWAGVVEETSTIAAQTVTVDSGAWSNYNHGIVGSFQLAAA